MPRLSFTSSDQGGARHAEGGGCPRNVQAQRLDALAQYKTGRVGWIFHRHGLVFFLRSVVVIVHGVPFWKHSPVKNARNQNSSGFLPVKHNMPFALHSAQASTNIITASTQ
jgi:hypothetical protein